MGGKSHCDFPPECILRKCNLLVYLSLSPLTKPILSFVFEKIEKKHEISAKTIDKSVSFLLYYKVEIFSNPFIYYIGGYSHGKKNEDHGR